MSAKILVFAGSIRNGSYNQQLADCLINALKSKDCEVTSISLKDFELPLYNADIETPENAQKLATLFSEHDGLVIVSPEYNASLTPLLKNTLDWVSTIKSVHLGAFGPFKDKVCYLASCSPGAIGGMRGLYHLRAVMMNVGADIITPQLAVGHAGNAFDGMQLVEDRVKNLMNSGLDDLLLAIKRVKAVPRA